MVRLYQGLLKTGILGTNPIRQVLYLLWCYLRFGASLYTLAAWAAQRYSSRIALKTQTKEISYQDLFLETDQVASGLYGLGLRAKQTLGLHCHNRIEFVQTLLAASRLGANIVLLNPDSSPEKINEQCRAQNIQFLVSDTPLETSSQTVILTPSFASFKNYRSRLPRRNMGSVLMLTSGSTGAAKVTRQKPTLQAALKTLTLFLERFQPKAERSTLLTLPMFHGHGLATLILSLLIGTRLHIFAKASIKQYLAAIQEQKIDAIVLVPTILYRILEQADQYDLHSIITIVTGSAPLTPELAKRTQQRFGLVLYNFYGSSEIGMISLATPTDLAEFPDSVGKPFMEVRMLGQNVFVGGQNTGDTGYLKDGRLYLTGRQDEMLICGGINIYPQILEQQIMQLEYVLECAVLGIPDPEYGQAIHLFVVLAENALLEQLENDLQRLMPRATRPKRITQLPELPRNAIGKLERHKL